MYWCAARIIRGIHVVFDRHRRYGNNGFQHTCVEKHPAPVGLSQGTHRQSPTCILSLMCRAEFRLPWRWRQVWLIIRQPVDGCGVRARSCLTRIIGLWGLEARAHKQTLSSSALLVRFNRWELPADRRTPMCVTTLLDLGLSHIYLFILNKASTFCSLLSQNLCGRRKPCRARAAVLRG